MTPAEKKKLSEADICAKFITPAIEKAGWEENTQLRREVSFTDGRVLVRGKVTTRGKAKRADYILYFKPNLPIAIVEAKDNKHGVGDGLEQAIEYGDILDIPFIYASNGDSFIEHDRTKTEEPIQDLALDEFPAPEVLWQRYCEAKKLTEEEKAVITEPYYLDSSGKIPRYYQMIAINRCVEAIAKGQRRLLLVMATGSGKSITAFQIIWRLWKAKKAERVLFLADRNILIDQTMVNDFKPFKGAMAKLSTKSKTIEKDNGEVETIPIAIKKKRSQVDKSYEIYLGLYQSLTGIEEKEKIFKDFSPDFFDMIVIDECHRGSAREDSAWREILEYFDSAVQLGMTATPKETKYVSNIHYFGDPVYTYSLKDGIEDGFLAPYKVARVGLNRDLEGWRPEKGQRDKHGRNVPDREYNVSDYDREIVLEQRTRVVAQIITNFLKETNRLDKTIIFCEDIDHAERMREALVNENPGLGHSAKKYIVRITGDNTEGKLLLDDFIDPESTHPVIVTTSKLMTTGVDAQTCKLIVLDRTINSMTEFKQIIGRGTRLREDYDKTWFTIMDFRGATRLFADPDFDGDPVEADDFTPGNFGVGEEVDEEEMVEVDPRDTMTGTPDEEGGPEEWQEGEKKKRQKYYIKDVEVYVINERIQYYGADGKLITESLKDYSKKAIRKKYSTLNKFLNSWSSAEKKTAIIKELEEEGVLFAALEEDVGKDLDAFDLVCHVAFDQKPLSRKERAQNVKKRNVFAKYSETAQKVLEALLEKYADEGLVNVEDMNVLKLRPINELGGIMEIVKEFGGKEAYQEAIVELEKHLYETA